jgi:hypothetical protein
MQQTDIGLQARLKNNLCHLTHIEGCEDYTIRTT